MNLTNYISSQIICERFETFFTADKMRKYGPEVYDMIQKSYAYIGGLAGCRSYEDFEYEYIDNAEKNGLMWKCVRRGDKITALRIYTTKRGGRKSIVMASDGTENGKKDLDMIIYEDFKLKDRNAWAEQSGKALGKSLKVGKQILPNTIINLLMPDKVATGDVTLLDDGFFYLRKIAGKLHCKAIVGNPPNGEAHVLNDEEYQYIKQLSMKYEQQYG